MPSGRSRSRSPPSSSRWKAVVVVGNYPTFILPPPEAGRGAVRSGLAWRLDDARTRSQRSPRSRSASPSGAVAGLAIGYGLAQLGPGRAPRFALHRRRPGDADPGPRPAPRLWFGAGLASKVVICALIVFFPIADLDDGRDPIGRCGPARDGPQLPRHPAPGPADPRDPSRAAVDPRRDAGRGDARGRRRDRRRVGRRRARASASSSTSPAAACSTSR